MKLFGKVRGLRLATKLALVGPVLILAPLYALIQQLDLESVFVEAQAQSMLRTAQGMSTIFNGREDLFENLALNTEDYEPIYAQPLVRPIRLDGDSEDWQEESERTHTFADGENEDAGFSISIGERDDAVYGFLEITDDRLVYRDARVLRLDNADHLRLEFLRLDGSQARLAITFTGPGIVTAYDMDDDWQFAESGKPENQVRGFIDETEQGYALEFRMPTDMLAPATTVGFAFVDVDDPETRTIRHITRSLPSAGRSAFNLVRLRSTELLNILDGLGFSDGHVMVIDADNRLRAASGAVSRNLATLALEDEFRPTAWLRDLIRPATTLSQDPRESEETATRVISSALAGIPSVERRLHANGFELITAAYPIVSTDRVLGTVVVEQATDRTLSMQSQAIDRLFGILLATFVLIMVALFGFSARLAWRIGHLRTETSRAIDESGRLKIAKFRREQKAGDEIGDLARSISTMLSSLQRYTGFLERMPRTLRHEIHNPLNTLTTSLENLAEEVEQARNSKYLASARRGVARIGFILQGLADAASLEESLKTEAPETCDVAALVDSYVRNCALNHPQREFVYRGPDQGLVCSIPDYRMEQVLDKLIDNAIDFGRDDSPVVVQVEEQLSRVRVSIANRGPILPTSDEQSVFESMVSHRSSQQRLHFGLGLYIVKIISEYHGGSARALNLVDGSGVMLVVDFPLLYEPTLPIFAKETQDKAVKIGGHAEVREA